MDKCYFGTGNNIAGWGTILGASYVDEATLAEEVAERYHHTPVFDPTTIPAGRYVHIGDGIWMHRCHECMDYILSYGSIAYLSAFAAHEATHAELLAAGIVGWNVGILS